MNTNVLFLGWREEGGKERTLFILVKECYKFVFGNIYYDGDLLNIAYLEGGHRLAYVDNVPKAAIRDLAHDGKPTSVAEFKTTFATI